MHREIVIEAFSVIGVEGRTSNAAEMRGMGIIPQLWERFMRDAATIPNRADANTVGVYSGYESNENGAYNLCVGAKVSSKLGVPPGMVLREVPAGRYAVFTSAQGPLTRIVPETWQTIWTEPQTTKYLRGYQTDFELYDTRAANPADARIDVYIGLK